MGRGESKLNSPRTGLGALLSKFLKKKDKEVSDTTDDHPAWMNIQLKARRNPEQMLVVFRKMHAYDKTESAITVDEQGFVTSYRHGSKGHISIKPGKNEMVYHNHPRGTTLSKTDLLSAARNKSKGVVASGKYGDFIFEKTGRFRQRDFIRALENAKIDLSSPKKHNESMNRFLTLNQKQYGFKFKHLPNRDGGAG